MFDRGRLQREQGVCELAEPYKSFPLSLHAPTVLEASNSQLGERALDVKYVAEA